MREEESTRDEETVTDDEKNGIEEALTSHPIQPLTTCTHPLPLGLDPLDLHSFDSPPLDLHLLDPPSLDIHHISI